LSWIVWKKSWSSIIVLEMPDTDRDEMTTTVTAAATDPCSYYVDHGGVQTLA